MSTQNPQRKSVEPRKGVQYSPFQSVEAWGDSSLPPALLATLIFPLHARPPQPLPLLFPPILLGASYANLSGYKTDAAGISGAWSGLYILLASRRKYGGGSGGIRGLRAGLKSKLFSIRGWVRGAALGVAWCNVLGGGWRYATGRGGRDGEWIGKGDGDE